MLIPQYYIGIDLHKRTSFLTLINQEGEILAEKNIHNEQVRPWVKEHVPIETIAVIEATGNWGYLYDELENIVQQVVLVHPKKVKAIASAAVKTDRIDAGVLATLARLNYLPRAYAAPKELRDLRSLVRYRDSMVRVKTKLKNRVHAILIQNNLHLPAADIFSKKGRSYLQTALEKIGMTEKVIIITSLKRIERLEVSSQSILEYGNSLLTSEQQKLLKLLQTAPGIGPVHALTILAEVGTIDRFPSCKAFANWTGLVPRVRNSGGKQHHGHISKQGSRYIRAAFTRAAASAKLKSPALKRKYNQFLERMPKIKATVALGHKLAIIIYFMWKRQESYDENKVLGVQRKSC
jgi:transposase